jgi:hypothetical protein
VAARVEPQLTARGRRLNGSERFRLAVEILIAYGNARAAMRRAPVASAVASLRQSGADSRHSQAPVGERLGETALSEAFRLGRAVRLTLRLLPGDTRCLNRSLVLTQLLARRGIPAKLVIGARPAPSFLAHAWVEHDGQPVLPIGDGSFGRLVEL